MQHSNATPYLRTLMQYRNAVNDLLTVLQYRASVPLERAARGRYQLPGSAATGGPRDVGGLFYGRPVILSRWDWERVAWQAPWKDALTFLAWPVLSAQPYVYQSESDLHRLMQAAWSAASVQVRHEVSLGRGLRIDFTSRGVGVEVKIAGHPVEVRKQLRRYAASGRLQALVLFTACPGYHCGEIPEHGYGIPTAVIDLWATRSLSTRPRGRPR